MRSWWGTGSRHRCLQDLSVIVWQDICTCLRHRSRCRPHHHESIFIGGCPAAQMVRKGHRRRRRSYCLLVDNCEKAKESEERSAFFVHVPSVQNLRRLLLPPMAYAVHGANATCNFPRTMAVFGLQASSIPSRVLVRSLNTSCPRPSGHNKVRIAFTRSSKSHGLSYAVVQDSAQEIGKRRSKRKYIQCHLPRNHRGSSQSSHTCSYGRDEL